MIGSNSQSNKRNLEELRLTEECQKCINDGSEYCISDLYRTNKETGEGEKTHICCNEENLNLEECSNDNTKMVCSSIPNQFKYLEELQQDNK